jgi:membrane-bound ClpP family serine protease
MAKLVTALSTAPKAEPVEPERAKPAPAATPGPAKGDAPKTEQPAPTDAPATIEDVRAALVTVAKSKGRDAALGVLTALNARNVGDLKAGDYGKAVDAAKKAA